MGDAALVRVALHAPPDGPLALGALLAGTLDFRASQAAAAADAASPRCVQARAACGGARAWCGGVAVLSAVDARVIIHGCMVSARAPQVAGLQDSGRGAMRGAMDPRVFM